MKNIIKSKKFWYAIGGILAMLISPKLGVPEAQLSEVIVMIGVVVTGLIGGQGLSDLGKEAKKIK